MDDPVNDAVLPTHLFPDEFPYDLDSESESGDQDEDEFLAQLTRRLTQKLAVPTLSCTHAKSQKKSSCMASSPQSTLSGLGSCCASGDGSPSQFPSPPTTPFAGQIDTWNLIYAAAGQVARLKMTNESPKFIESSGNRLFQTHPLVNRPSSSFYVKQSSVHNNLAEKNELYHRHGKWQIQSREKSCAGENLRSRGPSSWAAAIAVQSHNRTAEARGRTLLLAGSGAVRRESAGTGVFLPRRNGNSPEFRRKPGYTEANYSSNPGSSYDGFMTGRSAAAVTHINRSYRAEETRLPNEWTY